MTRTRGGRSIRTCVVLALLALSATPARGLSLFGLVDTGELFVSADGGATWSIRAALPVSDATALFAGATSTQLYLVSRSGSFHASADAGVNWTAIGTVPASDVAAAVPYSGGLLLFMKSGGVYVSFDAGNSFAAVGALTASDLVAGARLGNLVFALGEHGAVYRSSDAGASWDGVGALAVSNAVAMVSFEGSLYVLTATGDLARSDDLGVHWSFTSTLSQSGMSSLLAGANELVACTEAGEVAASGDGVGWNWRGTIGQLTVRALASDEPFSTSVGPPGRLDRPGLSAWPNPVRGVTTLVLDLDQAADVTVRVLDLAGREVARPIAGERITPGRTTRSWRPEALPGGLYFLHADMAGRSVAHRLVLLARP